ncbi:SDR family NAD(P)-dependent oxidoreductase [Rhodoferax sp.]|uniref:SDR family NAD(P)-dependent oxidoreductase n=1 Tax=Rhodoferax sp. TaxID=50421 RepID=UPI0025CCE892|nr:SDR family NAD(P)-dependent oxidoreductase [Rhodoferax sp.]MCM2340530.1 SDR family oxidoreductase [Rhodoferax sp.]
MNNMVQRERGKVAIITGGAGGLGLSIAERLSRNGVRVAVWDIDAQRAEAAARTLPDARSYAVDVTDAAAVEQATAQVVSDFGRLDILVTSAGHNGPNVPIADYPLDGWRKTIALNLDAVFFCCRAATREMLKTSKGRIVNMSSIAGKEGNPNLGAYSAAKAGVIGLTKSLGKELALTDIRVNCVTPAAIDTDILKQLSPEFLNYVKSKIPMGRLGRAEEIADLVAWLASEECSFTTGAVFDISGGRATY